MELDEDSSLPDVELEFMKFSDNIHGASGLRLRRARLSQIPDVRGFYRELNSESRLRYVEINVHLFTHFSVFMSRPAGGAGNVKAGLKRRVPLSHLRWKSKGQPRVYEELNVNYLVRREHNAIRFFT
jgi:hypothetical protein